MNCTPESSCSDTLKKLTAAYFSVLEDGGVQEVTIGEDTTRYHKNDLEAMKTTIAALHAECPSATSNMIMGGRRRPMGLCFEESHRCRNGRC